ncbi:MAG: hypothetical protein ACTSYC_08190 [Promethearchaeota archaeon]
MSIHGPQYILPLFMDKRNKSNTFKNNEELTLAFYLLTKELDENSKLISFSRLLWPFLTVQGIIGKHVFLDSLFILNKEGKLTNPPRQPLIGHVLRNIENRTQIEQLERIIEILTYKDTEAEEIGKGEESEYRSLVIKGLVNPSFLKTLSGLLTLIEYQPIDDYMPLETNLSVEKALDIAQLYGNTIKEMKGNAQRWDMQIDLIQKEINKILKNINVEIKDTTMRYDAKIKKISAIIDDTMAEEQFKKESDKIDQWKTSEKKKLIENFSLTFKNLELSLEAIIKNNKFFGNPDLLKTKLVEDLIVDYQNHINYLETEAKKFMQTLGSIKEKYQELKTLMEQIDNETNQKLLKYKNQLDSKIRERNKQVTKITNEKIDLINNLNDLKIQIENLASKIKEIIAKKRETCLKEAEELKEWSLSDEISDIFSRPVQWIYMPIYVLFYENQDAMEEKMNIIFPGYIDNESITLYLPFSEDFESFKKLILNKIETDIILRSNFEFSCENKNLLKDLNFTKKIQQGLSNLRNLLLHGEQEHHVRKMLNSIS